MMKKNLFGVNYKLNIVENEIYNKPISYSFVQNTSDKVQISKLNFNFSTYYNIKVNSVRFLQKLLPT